MRILQRSADASNNTISVTTVIAPLLVLHCYNVSDVSAAYIKSGSVTPVPVCATGYQRGILCCCLAPVTYTVAYATLCQQDINWDACRVSFSVMLNYCSNPRPGTFLTQSWEMRCATFLSSYFIARFALHYLFCAICSALVVLHY